MIIINIIISELRRIYVILFALFPVIAMSLFVLTFRDYIEPEEIPDTIEVILIVFIFWSLPILVPIYIFVFSLMPTYHKFGNSYYFVKLYKLSPINLNTIEKVEKVEGILGPLGARHFGTGYNYYFKGENFPVRIVYRKHASWYLQYPRFAEEIITKFPPEDFPPLEKKGSGGNL